MATNSPHTTAAALLREGVQAAERGNRVKARFLIRQAVEHAPSGGPAWLWLAELADSPDDHLDCLRQAHHANPKDATTATALANALVGYGAELASQGRPDEGRQAFREALQIDPANVPALLWAADTAPTPEEAVGLYGRVLALDPANEIARDGVELHRPTAELCPICRTARPRGARACPACRAVLALDNPTAFDGPTVCDVAVVEANLPRLGTAAERDPAEWLPLGLAYLNLGRSALAACALKAAVGQPALDPAVREQVLRIAERQLSGKSTVRIRRPDVTPAATGPRVIVAAHDPATRATVSAALGSAGYRTTCVCDGTEIHAAVLLDGAPDLVVLAADMPNLSGAAAGVMLRQRTATKAVPILFLADTDRQVKKARGQLTGRVEYLTRPFQPIELLAVAEHLAPVSPSPLDAETVIMDSDTRTDLPVPPEVRSAPAGCTPTTRLEPPPARATPPASTVPAAPASGRRP